MLEYENLKAQPRKFLAQTSLTVAEFENVLPAFEKAYLKKFPVKKTKTGKSSCDEKSGGARRTGEAGTGK
jgi:hypothetical protein